MWWLPQHDESLPMASAKLSDEAARVIGADGDDGANLLQMAAQQVRLGHVISMESGSLPAYQQLIPA